MNCKEKSFEYLFWESPTWNRFVCLGLQGRFLCLYHIPPHPHLHILINIGYCSFFLVLFSFLHLLCNLFVFKKMTWTKCVTTIILVQTPPIWNQAKTKAVQNHFIKTLRITNWRCKRTLSRKRRLSTL